MFSLFRLIFPFFVRILVEGPWWLWWWWYESINDKWKEKYRIPKSEQHWIAILMFQVFSATNVELVTKTRTEHLTDADKEKSSPRSPIQSFLNIAEVEEKQNSPSSEEVSNTGLQWHLYVLVWFFTVFCTQMLSYLINIFKWSWI